MEYSSGKSTSPDRFEPVKPGPFPGQSSSSPPQEAFSTAQFEKMFETTKEMCGAGACMFMAGLLSGALLTILFKALKPETAPKRRITKLDLAVFAGMYPLWFGLMLYWSHPSSWPEGAGLGVGVLINWAWLWYLGITIVSNYAIGDSIARALTVGIVVPAARSGLLVFGFAFIIGTIMDREHIDHSDEISLAVKMIATGLIGIVGFGALVLGLELSRRRMQPEPPVEPPPAP